MKIILLFIAVVFVTMPACQHAGEDSVDYYTCPMHPQIRADLPGQCPVCGMDLEPVMVRSSENGTHGHNDNAIHSVTIEPGFTQSIGIVTERIKTRSLVKSITAFGKAAHDRDLWVAQNEFIEALKLGDRKLIESTRSKLVFMGLSEAWIEELQKSRKPDHELHLTGLEGSNFFEAYVSQDDAKSVVIGDAVAILNTQGRELAFGKVKAISTLVDMNSRTIRVMVKSKEKIDVKPNSFVQFRIETTLGDKLSVPHRAVLFNGDATLVYVSPSPGKFEPRSIKLGAHAGDYDEIIEGVNENENVVVNGHFLIDAETQIRFGSSPEHQH